MVNFCYLVYEFSLLRVYVKGLLGSSRHIHIYVNLASGNKGVSAVICLRLDNLDSGSYTPLPHSYATSLDSLPFTLSPTLCTTGTTQWR
jgi:hypothetical protein